VPPKRHEELAWAVNYLLGDEAARRRYAEAGPIRAAEFSWESVGARVEAYYEELCAQYHPRVRLFAAPAAAAAAAAE
jgi:glycosyltransferase involved in cell wall biosynthesis